jgi:MinD superfamily P-loop ATPase
LIYGDASMTQMPVIDHEKCDGCGLCVEVCECGALVMVNHVIQIRETVDCRWCTFCELVCPTGAIQCPFDVVAED